MSTSLCICYLGKEAIDITSFINIFMQHSAVRSQKVQGHTCYLTKIFLQGLNHLTVTVSGLVECFGMGL